jgi:deazaflavin-dependent oxidoreductase (nitroreductase family)
MSDEPLLPKVDWVREHAERYLASNGADGHEWNGVTTLLLTTRGKQSGRLRVMPLIYGRDGDSYVVVASKGGAPVNPGWFHNLLAEPEVRIQVGSEVMESVARVAEPDERDRLWTQMTEIWPDYEKYQARTERVIPLVVITPRD